MGMACSFDSRQATSGRLQHGCGANARLEDFGSFGNSPLWPLSSLARLTKRFSEEKTAGRWPPVTRPRMAKEVSDIIEGTLAGLNQWSLPLTYVIGFGLVLSVLFGLHFASQSTIAIWSPADGAQLARPRRRHRDLALHHSSTDRRSSCEHDLVLQLPFGGASPDRIRSDSRPTMLAPAHHPGQGRRTTS